MSHDLNRTATAGATGPSGDPGPEVEVPAPAEAPQPWNRDLHSELAEYARSTTRSHLDVYTLERRRLEEDVRSESGVLETAYRRRQLIELIQNGADALLGSHGGRIEAVLTTDALIVGNEGRPVDQKGVDSLLFHNLTAKSGKEIGRLGVGFKSVLELTDRPFFLSRSLSLSFDRKRTEQLLRAKIARDIEAVPVVRFGDPTDPVAVVAEFPTVAPMLDWASTVVILPLDQAELNWLSEIFDEDKFRREFLLFSPHVSSLRFVDEVRGTERSITLTRDHDDLVLDDDAADGPSRWRVRTVTVQLDEAAKKDGGARFERPEVDLAWALPVDERHHDREIWSFFPVEGVSTALPGILNSAWKLSESRDSLSAGEFNEYLLRHAARLVVETVPTHVPERLPGLALDLLPAPPAAKGEAVRTGWVSQYLQEQVWSIAPHAPVVPAADGSWRRARDVALWPAWIRRPGSGSLAETWQQAVVAPEDWVHRTVMTESRSARAHALGSVRSNIHAWLEAVRDDEVPKPSAKLALELVDALLDHSPAAEDHSSAMTAAVVWTEAESWIDIASCRFDDDAPPETRPADGLKRLVRRVHKKRGISADIGERHIVQLAKQSSTGGLSRSQAEQFWEAVHSVGAARSLRVIGPDVDLSRLPVRTAAGQFKLSTEVLLSGEFIGSDEDPAVCVDPSFHCDDDPLLSAIGVVKEPTFQAPDRAWDGPYRAFLRYWEPQWQDLNARHGARPRDGFGAAGPQNDPWRAPSIVPTHASVIAACSDAAKERFTRLLMQIEGWDEPWVLFHETQSAKYRKLTIPSPPAHVLRQHGVLPTTMGPRPWKLTFGSEFADWADLLPVAILEPRALRCLDLDAPMETQLEERWLDGGFALLADAASRSEDGRLVRLLRIAADHGLKPVDGFELPPLTDRPAEAVELRDAGQTVWISPSELLTSWPSGWDFHGVERPPAEPVGEVEVVSMDEYFPALVGRIDDAVQVWECDGVLVDQRPVPVGRRGDAFLVTRGSDRPMVLRWIVDNLLPQVPAAEREDLVSQHLAAEYEALAERVRSQPDDAARLAVLLGQDGLRSACREAAPWAAERSALDQAELLLTLFGPSVLKELSNLIPAGLGVPGQWAGGQRTLEFVRYLGFGDEFAGRRKAERSDAERVLGPTEVGELHDFQVEIAERVQEIIATSGRGMVDLPTGAGKTRVTVESLLRHAHSVGGLGVVLWIAEREELCEQAVTAWLQLWRAKGLRDRELTVLRYWGGSRQTQKDVGRDTVIIASRQQLRRRIDNGAASWIAQANLVVIDEAHHTTASSYIDIIQWRQAERESSFAVLGLSATPFRSDFERTVHLVRLFDRSLVAGELMGDVWKDRIRWLQERRYLSSVKWTPLNRGEVAPTEREAELLLDQSNLTTGIDLINERLGDDHERNLQIIGSIQEMNPAWSVVVFAGSVRHAKTLAMMLNDVGIRARPVWGELTRWARRHAIEEFRSGRVRVLTNFNVLSEGFDAPKTRAVVIARLVQSDGLFLQMLGRGMRGPKNGGTKKCLLVTTGERLPRRFDRDGNLDIQRHEYLWNPR